MGIYTNIAKTAVASLYFQCYNPISHSGHPRGSQNIGWLRCGGCTRVISGPRPTTYPRGSHEKHLKEIVVFEIYAIELLGSMSTDEA